MQIIGEHVVCKAHGQGKYYGPGCRPHDCPLDCKFPFEYNGVTYSGCAPSSSAPNSTHGGDPCDGDTWCATKVDANGKMQEWARCNKYCLKDEGMISSIPWFSFIIIIMVLTTIFIYLFYNT